MFVFNSDGVYMPALRPPKTFDIAKDPRDLQVRARRRIDLERLRENWLPELGKTIKLKGTDYEFRAYCTRQQWGQALAAMAEAIDYVKYKETTHHDAALYSLCNRVWGAIFDALSPKAGAFLGARRRDTRRAGALWNDHEQHQMEQLWDEYNCPLQPIDGVPGVGESRAWTDQQWWEALEQQERTRQESRDRWLAESRDQ